MTEQHRSKVADMPAQLAAWWHKARCTIARQAPAIAPAGEPLAGPAGGVDRVADAEVHRLPELLARRLAALGLDPIEIARWSPALLADLDRNCCACADRARCIDDMAEGPLAAGWESYCPNSGTLGTL